MIGTQTAADAAERRSGTYVYGIVRTREPLDLGPIGIGGRGDLVHTVHVGELGALVSSTPLSPYDPTADNVRAHEQVNQAAMKRHTVLPLAFGTLFKSEADVIELMRRAENDLLSALTKIEGKVEFNLRASWDPEHELELLERQHPAIGQIRQRLANPKPGGSYFNQVELGRQLDALMERLAGSYIQRINEALEGTYTAIQTNKPVGSKMILNAAYLVDRQEEERFEEAVERVGAMFDQNLTFRLSGPWPPYNFVRIQFKSKGSG